MLSIVLPTFNESRTTYLENILASLQQVADAEVILVDGGSSDGTLDKLKASPFTVMELPHSTRAARLNLGIKAANGSCIFLHHPRSLVEPGGFEAAQRVCEKAQPVWGGLSHRFDHEHKLLQFTSWYSNRIRLDRGGIVYLDHCIFFNKAFMEKGIQLPDVAIFEDTELSVILRQECRPTRLNSYAQTSAIRFTNNGVVRQSLLNQFMKFAYYLGISPQRMNRLYEKGLGLNMPNADNADK